MRNTDGNSYVDAYEHADSYGNCDGYGYGHGNGQSDMYAQLYDHDTGWDDRPRYYRHR